MNETWRRIIWQQFGAAIDALENAMRACPESLWGDRSKQPEFWYIVFHTLFWLDFYVLADPDRFKPPAPFGLEEMDPAGVLPDRVYSKDELLIYLEHDRRACREAIRDLTEEGATRRYRSGRKDLPYVEWLLYNMRHVQHHAGQLHLILRREIDSAPLWTTRARQDLDGSPAAS
ncbi:MAG TPA: DinB family protein [Candidatus Eisenbacteria bacterium]